MTDTTREDQLETVCSLGDPTRRALYEHVARAREPVSRDDAAEAVDVDRSVAAYHLDKLVDEGLLAASFARPEGRGGPGAGRPAKHYERADIEVTASAPPRDYRLIADLLARALDAGGSSAVAGALRGAAEGLGAELVEGLDAEVAGGTDGGQLWDLLEAHGYQPYRDGDVIRLRNCPFHRLARAHTELVCGVNLAMMAGVVHRLGASDLEPTLDPAPGRCCVAFRPR